MHMKFEIEIRKANLTYAPEIMSSTDRRTDERTDGRADGQGESSIHPLSSLGGGIDTAKSWKYSALPL